MRNGFIKSVAVIAMATMLCASGTVLAAGGNVETNGHSHIHICCDSTDHYCGYYRTTKTSEWKYKWNGFGATGAYGCKTRTRTVTAYCSRCGRELSKTTETQYRTYLLDGIIPIGEWHY